MSRGRTALVVLLCGGLLSLAFPEPDIAPLAWIAIAPFLIVSRGLLMSGGMLLGFAFGLGFFGSLLIWIKYVGWIPWVILVIFQSCFFALFGAGWALFSRRLRMGTALMAAACLWVAVEYLRANFPVLGFTWGQLAQSQHEMAWLLPMAGVTGGWGIALLLASVNLLLAYAFGDAQRTTRRRRVWALTAAATLIVVPVLMAPAVADGLRARVAIVQGNVPRTFTGTISEKDLVILSAHAKLTRRLTGRNVDLVVWPESSVGLDMTQNNEVGRVVTGSARAVGAPMIVGGNRDVGDDFYEVIAFHIAADGDIADRYQKTHLVPFGEYVPWRGTLSWISMLEQVPRDAIAGTEGKVFAVAGGKVAPVISFEGDFGSLVRERIGEAGGRLLVVATNTSTWETSWASAQHLAFSQVRAAENGVWVAHAALSGISGFVAPDGSVAQRTDLWTRDVLVEEVAFAREPTFYARTGDWLPIICIVIVGVALVASLRRRAVA